MGSIDLMSHTTVIDTRQESRWDDRRYYSDKRWRTVQSSIPCSKRKQTKRIEWDDIAIGIRDTRCRQMPYWVDIRIHSIFDSELSKLVMHISIHRTVRYISSWDFLGSGAEHIADDDSMFSNGPSSVNESVGHMKHPMGGAIIDKWPWELMYLYVVTTQGGERFSMCTDVFYISYRYRTYLLTEKWNIKDFLDEKLLKLRPRKKCMLRDAVADAAIGCYEDARVELRQARPAWSEKNFLEQSPFITDAVTLVRWYFDVDF